MSEVTYEFGWGTLYEKRRDLRWIEECALAIVRTRHRGTDLSAEKLWEAMTEAEREPYREQAVEVVKVYAHHSLRAIETGILEDTNG